MKCLLKFSQSSFNKTQMNNFRNGPKLEKKKGIKTGNGAGVHVFISSNRDVLTISVKTRLLWQSGFKTKIFKKCSLDLNSNFYILRMLKFPCSRTSWSSNISSWEGGLLLFFYLTFLCFIFFPNEAAQLSITLNKFQFLYFFPKYWNPSGKAGFKGFIPSSTHTNATFSP